MRGCVPGVDPAFGHPINNRSEYLSLFEVYRHHQTVKETRNQCVWRVERNTLSQSIICRNEDPIIWVNLGKRSRATQPLDDLIG